MISGAGEYSGWLRFYLLLATVVFGAISSYVAMVYTTRAEIEKNAIAIVQLQSQMVQNTNKVNDLTIAITVTKTVVLRIDKNIDALVDLQHKMREREYAR